MAGRDGRHPDDGMVAEGWGTLEDDQGSRAHPRAGATLPAAAVTDGGWAP
jgi:hypothetical protein